MSNNKKKEKKKWKTESVTPLALSNDRIVKKLRIYVARLPFAVCRLSFIAHRLSDYKAAQISDLMPMSGMSNSI